MYFITLINENRIEKIEVRDNKEDAIELGVDLVFYNILAVDMFSDIGEHLEIDTLKVDIRNYLESNGNYHKDDWSVCINLLTNNILEKFLATQKSMDFDGFLQDACMSLHDQWTNSGGEELGEFELQSLNDLLSTFFQDKLNA